MLPLISCWWKGWLTTDCGCIEAAHNDHPCDKGSCADQIKLMIFIIRHDDIDSNDNDGVDGDSSVNPFQIINVFDDSEPRELGIAAKCNNQLCRCNIPLMLGSGNPRGKNTSLSVFVLCWSTLANPNICQRKRYVSLSPPTSDPKKRGGEGLRILVVGWQFSC